MTDEESEVLLEDLLIEMAEQLIAKVREERALKNKKCHLNDTGDPRTSYAMSCAHTKPCSECDKYY